MQKILKLKIQIQRKKNEIAIFIYKIYNFLNDFNF